MSLGTKALIGLVAGLATGIFVAAAGPALAPAGTAADVMGTLWINAILMTILPLVVSKLIVSITAHDDGPGLGRAGWRAGVTFLALLTVTAALAAFVMPAVFARLPIDEAASAALRAGAQPAAPAASPVKTSQWIVALVPTNAVRAAADGAIVPLLVFAVAFAVAASRIPRALRDPLVALFRAIDATISVLLQWIVALSPYGVFALGLGLAMRVGGGIVTALVYYVVVSSAVMVVITAALYLVVYLVAGVSPGLFARAAAPAQVLALGTHSSMAALPAMLEGAENRLRLSRTATGFVLPMALAVFKVLGPRVVHRRHVLHRAALQRRDRSVTHGRRRRGICGNEFRHRWCSERGRCGRGAGTGGRRAAR